MILFVLNLLRFFTFAVFATPIPPNCTLTHGDYVESGSAVPPMWTCPEGSPTIWRQQLCDNFYNCRRSLGDEKICVDYGPVGSSNLTFIDEKVPVGHSATPVVPRIYIPDFDCSAPLCVSDEGEVDLSYKAHLICRQMARATFQRLALVENDEKRWPVALSPDAIRCAGREETVQQCSSLSSMKKPFLVDKCQKLLALSCAAECARALWIDERASGRNDRSFERGEEMYFAPPRGVLTSPGFPNFFLPHLDCTWTLTTSNQRRVFVLNVTVLNLQEFDVRPVDREDGEDQKACSNSYVEIGLGLHPNGTYIKKRMCKEDSVGMNLTSFGNRIYVRYVSGQYMGSVIGEKGFALSYYTAESDLRRSDPSPMLTPPIIILIAFAFLIAFIAVFVGALYCFNKSKFRARRVAKKRRSDMVDRLNSNRVLPLLRAPDTEGYFTPPVTCSTCNERIVHVADLCPHYARLLQYVTDIDYTEVAKRSARRVRHRSHNSNVTIDIDELIRADRELRKQQKRWRSMDVSCVDSLRTAVPFESSYATSYTVQLGTSADLGSERRISDDDQEQKVRDPTLRKLSPQVAAKNAAAAVRNFLTTAVVEKARSGISSWRTPSPRRTSIPEHLQCPEIAIKEAEAIEPAPIVTAYSLTPSPCAQTLTVAPARFRSA